MTGEKTRLDDVLEIFQDSLVGIKAIQVAELYASNDPPGIGAPVRSLSILINAQIIAILGLTTQAVSPRSPGFLAYISRRARARKSPYIVMTNQREALLIVTPIRDGDSLKVLRVYPLLSWIDNNLTDSISVPERNALIQLANKIASDILTLKRDNRLDMVIPDPDFFVERLTHAVDILKPAVKKALQTKLGMDAHFARELEAWAIPQGIPADLHSADFAEAVVRQAIYRMLGKIIFYQSLRRAVTSLPEMNMSGLAASQVLPSLNDCFAQAHNIDYHAVFRVDIVDRLPFPEAAATELRNLVSDLNTRDFAHLPQDVVGAVFERLIPPEDRHALGQFFTPENLVDLIIGFCVRHPDDYVLDPTCGTGTFLIRAYDRLRTAMGEHDHNRLLSQLWGIDIAPFPAELATINLFRQQVGVPGNFPRIMNEDFFDILPGGEYRFPPLKAASDILSTGNGMVKESIPFYDAIIGNFPYISADRIEWREKGYLKKINDRLAVEWLREYPTGFTFSSKNDEKQHHLAHEYGLNIEPYLGKAKSHISTYADLYVYLFWHAAAFLKSGGRMGIVTSNAWLDVGYGYVLQRFFLDHFKIVAILESRCEPWFNQAAVNTIVTLIERCDIKETRENHPVRFVKVKVRLSELIPWDVHLDVLNRWNGISKIVQRIEAIWRASDDPVNPSTWEDDDFQVKSIRQGILSLQLEERRQTVKWGVYLRAPQVYFDLIHQLSRKLALIRDIAPPARGGTTRVNEFFHINQTTIQKWGIDDEFCWPLIKSPSETDTILIDRSKLGLKVFVCRKDKDELRKDNQIGTLHYIEWGEQQIYKSGVQRGMKWPDGPWVKDRKPGWYSLPKSETPFSQLFFTQAYGDRHIQRYCGEPIIPDTRLYYLSPDRNIAEMISAVLNTSIVALLTELAGRVTLGDGVLELKVEDARDYLYIPDVRMFDNVSKNAILKAFQPILNRPIGNVFEEVTKSDRQELDRAVLDAMGLKAKEWLPQIYEGLTTLVHERTHLGQMRGQTRKSKPQKAARRVADDVLYDVIPNGPMRFPGEFLSPLAQTGPFHDISLPVQYIGPMMGKEELRAQDGHQFTLANKYEVRFLLFCQASGHSVAHIPNQTVEVSRTVNNYIQYLRDLRDRLHQTYFKRTFDQVASDRFVEDTWRKYNLPDLEK